VVVSGKDVAGTTSFGGADVLKKKGGITSKSKNKPISLLLP
jgi:hypothetical protein